MCGCMCGCEMLLFLFVTRNLCPCFQVRVANVLMATSRHLSAAKWRVEIGEVECAECDHKDKDKNKEEAREARQSPLLQWSTSQARVWPSLRCFALISLLMKSRTAI